MRELSETHNPVNQANADRIFFLRVNSSAFDGLIDCTNQRENVILIVQAEKVLKQLFPVSATYYIYCQNIAIQEQ